MSRPCPQAQRPPREAPVHWPVSDRLTRANLEASKHGGRLYRAPDSAPRTLPENAIRMHQPGSGHGVRR